jgi:hypothetical protein
MKKNISLALFYLLCLLTFAYASTMVRVAGIDLPLMEQVNTQARKISQGAQATVLTLVVHASADEAINFYDSYFKENGFLVIGKKVGSVYNVSVKKGDSLFGVRIYTEDQKTILQFIW